MLYRITFRTNRLALTKASVASHELVSGQKTAYPRASIGQNWNREYNARQGKYVKSDPIGLEGCKVPREAWEAAYRKIPMHLLDMVDTAGDKLLLLLSTDWFTPYWSCVGLYLPERDKLEVQSHLREEVRRSFVGATYWNALFDAERVQRTRQALLHAFAGNAAAARTIDSFLQHSTPSEEAGPSWLLSSMTEMLLSGSDEHVSIEVVDLVRAAWRVASMGSKNWRDLCSQSSSSWDETVKGLTPDLPCWLADVLAAEIQVTDTFGMYWSELRDILNGKQRGELLQWYEKTALDLTGEAIDLGALQ